MNLGVRLAKVNSVLAEEFSRAMDAWAAVLDFDWRPDESQNCAIQVIEGEKQLFDSDAMAARSQLPDRLNFQGWIAFNPRMTLTGPEWYRIAVHEIGHILGLQHSDNADSVMYSLDLDGQEWLDATDLAALAHHHRLRISDLDHAIRIGVSTRASAR